MNHKPINRPGDAARRRRIRRQIRREAEMRMAGISHTPTLREIYAPRVIFAAIFVLAIIGGFLVHKVDRRVRENPDRPIPHLVAVKSLDVLATALGRYKFHVGHFPTTEQGLRALNADTGEPGWDGPYLVQLMEDPWGRMYFYERGTNDIPVLLSCGPDGVPGTRDDLRPGESFYDPGEGWTNGWKHRWEKLPEITLGD